MGRAASRASSELSTPGRLCRWCAAPHRTDLYWVFSGGCEHPPSRASPPSGGTLRAGRWEGGRPSVRLPPSRVRPGADGACPARGVPRTRRRPPRAGRLPGAGDTNPRRSSSGGISGERLSQAAESQPGHPARGPSGEPFADPSVLHRLVSWPCSRCRPCCYVGYVAEVGYVGIVNCVGQGGFVNGARHVDHVGRAGVPGRCGAGRAGCVIGRGVLEARTVIACNGKRGRRLASSALVSDATPGGQRRARACHHVRKPRSRPRGPRQWSRPRVAHVEPHGRDRRALAPRAGSVSALHRRGR
jgi:hypothetical protein